MDGEFFTIPGITGKGVIRQDGVYLRQSSLMAWLYDVKNACAVDGFEEAEDIVGGIIRMLSEVEIEPTKKSFWRR